MHPPGSGKALPLPLPRSLHPKGHEAGVHLHHGAWKGVPKDQVLQGSFLWAKADQQEPCEEVEGWKEDGGEGTLAGLSIQTVLSLCYSVIMKKEREKYEKKRKEKKRKEKKRKEKKRKEKKRKEKKKEKAINLPG